jgi:hypothetical protein
MLQVDVNWFVNFVADLMESNHIIFGLVFPCTIYFVAGPHVAKWKGSWQG